MLDLIIKNAKNTHDEILDIGVNNGKITHIGKIEQDANKIIDLKCQTYVSFGWIDCHVHCYTKMDLYSDNPDIIGIKSGVATIIDAGSCGADNIDDFFAQSKTAKTNVYAMLNISRIGLVAQNELSKITNIEPSLVKKACEAHPSFILGLKARMSKTVIGDNGITPLNMALSMSNDTKLPLMVHIGSNPPTLEEILNLLGPGHIVTHCFNGKPNGIFDQSTGKIKPCAHQALNRGVAFDIGHGTDSFNFNVATIAKNEDIYATSISSDIYYRNRVNGPVFNLATTMEKLLHIGYSLPSVIDKVTKSPAKLFNLKLKGEIITGFDADLTIFDIINEEKELIDSNAQKIVTNTQIIPKYTIVGGEVYEC